VRSISELNPARVPPDSTIYKPNLDKASSKASIEILIPAPDKALVNSSLTVLATSDEAICNLLKFYVNSGIVPLFSKFCHSYLASAPVIFNILPNFSNSSSAVKLSISAILATTFLIVAYIV
jgi:hypothetical protein